MNKYRPLAGMLIALLMITACTRIYTHRFSIDTIDSFDSQRTLYTAVRQYLLPISA